MSRYFDRAGNPITMEEWMKLFESAKGEDGKPNPRRHVAHDTVNDPQGREHYVSTVWLGLDHSLGSPDEPLIFETMVFCHGHECEWDNFQDRYSTEEQAAANHVMTVELVKRKETSRMEV